MELLVRTWVVLHITPSMFDEVSVHVCVEVFTSVWRLVWRFLRGTFYLGPWKIKLILACQGVLKSVWPSL